MKDTLDFYWGSHWPAVASSSVATVAAAVAAAATNLAMFTGLFIVYLVTLGFVIGMGLREPVFITRLTSDGQIRTTRKIKEFRTFDDEWGHRQVVTSPPGSVMRGFKPYNSTPLWDVKPNPAKTSDGYEEKTVQVDVADPNGVRYYNPMRRQAINNMRICMIHVIAAGILFATQGWYFPASALVLSALYIFVRTQPYSSMTMERYMVKAGRASVKVLCYNQHNADGILSYVDIGDGEDTRARLFNVSAKYLATHPEQCEMLCVTTRGGRRTEAFIFHKGTLESSGLVVSRSLKYGDQVDNFAPLEGAVFIREGAVRA